MKRIHHATTTVSTQGRALAATLVLLGAAACDGTAPFDPASVQQGVVGSPECEEQGVMCTWAGTGKHGFNGDGLPLAQSHLYWPIDVTFDPSGHTYVVDWNNHRVREVTPAGAFETVIGTDFVGDGPPDQSDLTDPGAPGTEVVLNHPTQLVPTDSGKPILVAWHNHKLRQFDPDTGLVRVICGGPAGFSGDGMDAHTAKLNQPNQMVIANDGTQYILDQRNQAIRKIDTDGVISTPIGTPMTAGFAGDNGPPNEARFSFPTGSNPPPGGGLALDDDGNLYISDTLNHRIRKVDFEANLITTIAGTGEAGYGGDSGPADEALLNGPRKLTIGPDGRLYVGDEHNHRIRAIDLDSGIIRTVAGNGEQGYSGDGEAATDASLDSPAGVAFDEAGHMYVIDTFNSRVRRVAAGE